MRTDTVEIYSDATNAAIVRHPGRRFPGLLIQGDTMHALCALADATCTAIGRGGPGYEEANELRNRLQDFRSYYKIVLGEHDIPLPFSDHDVSHSR